MLTFCSTADINTQRCENYVSPFELLCSYLGFPVRSCLLNLLFFVLSPLPPGSVFGYATRAKAYLSPSVIMLRCDVRGTTGIYTILWDAACLPLRRLVLFFVGILFVSWPSRYLREAMFLIHWDHCSIAVSSRAMIIMPGTSQRYPAFISIILSFTSKQPMNKRHPRAISRAAWQANCCSCVYRLNRLLEEWVP